MTSPRALSRLAALAAVAVLALTGCAAEANTGSAAPPAGSVTGVTIPDAFTALTLTAIGNPPLPFLATDGKYHVAYDLQLTKATQQAATLDTIEVVDAYDPTQVIASLSGSALVDTNCMYGDCNRLRSLPAGYLEADEIPPQEPRVVFIDFAFESLDDLPGTPLHRISGTGATSPAFGSQGAIEYLTTPVPISTETLPVVSPPVRGDNWVALNGCCGPGFPHRSSVMSVNGKLNNGQRKLSPPERRSAVPSAASSTRRAVAPECFTVFVSASTTMR